MKTRTIIELLYFTKYCMEKYFGKTMINYNSNNTPGFCMLIHYMKLPDFMSFGKKCLTDEEAYMLENYFFNHMPVTAIQWYDCDKDEILSLTHMLLFEKYNWTKRYKYLLELIHEEEKRNSSK